MTLLNERRLPWLFLSLLLAVVALGAYHGDTPVHVQLGATRLELPEWPVKICTELVSELKSVRGIAIERAGSA